MKKQLLFGLASLSLLISMAMPALASAVDTKQLTDTSTTTTQKAVTQSSTLTPDKVDAIIDNRLKSLDKLQAYLKGSKNITAKHREVLIGQITKASSSLQDYHARVKQHKDDPTLLTKDYNDARYDFDVYSLFIPRASLVVHSDAIDRRVNAYQKYIKNHQSKVNKQDPKVKAAFADFKDGLPALVKQQKQASEAVEKLIPLTPAEFNKPANHSLVKEADKQVTQAKAVYAKTKADRTKLVGAINEQAAARKAAAAKKAAARRAASSGGSASSSSGSSSSSSTGSSSSGGGTSNSSSPNSTTSQQSYEHRASGPNHTSSPQSSPYSNSPQQQSYEHRAR